MYINLNKTKVQKQIFYANAMYIITDDVVDDVITLTHLSAGHSIPLLKLKLFFKAKNVTYFHALLRKSMHNT